MTPRPSIIPQKKSFFGVIKEKVAEAIGDDKSRKPRAKWYDYRMQVPSQRQIRRIRDRDIDRTTKKFHRQQAQAKAAIAKHNERVAVKVLRAFEEAQGMAPGGLLEAMIADETIDFDIDEVPGHHSKSFTPQEILSAAGLTPEKIQELHEELERVTA